MYHAQIFAKRFRAIGPLIRAQHGARLPARRHASAVIADASDLSPLDDFLRGLPRRQVDEACHPMRPAWWSLAFGTALSAEWALRRRGAAR